ncbi:uncharacterized protein LOC123535753 isoform X2 [Mercenaria mercenaria]|nr:uncharacterized protein LOC123535753 isoform X2 [Mercenaria mercenaria]
MAGSLPWQRCSTVHPASLAKHPQTWSKEEIGAWLRWCTEEYSIEPIPPEKFDLNGKALCLLSRSDFMERVPRNGDVLFNCLQTLIAKHAGSGMVFQQNVPGQDIYQSFSGEHMPSKSTSISDHMTTAGFLIVPSTSSMTPGVSTSLTAVARSSYVPIKPHPFISVPVRHPQDDTIATFVRSNVHLGEKVFPGTTSMLEQRPPGSEHSLDSLRHDASSDCRLLWEFIYQLLSNAKYSNYVCWEDKDDYVFRIINPTGLAELWGQQKNRTNMTYEKLSRALRYYYRMNIIKKVQGKRLTYRFLQPPSCIQKGQRGAKPHYKIQMDMIRGQQGSQQFIKRDPDSPASGCATATASYSPSAENKSSDEDVDEADSEHDSRQIVNDTGSSRSSPCARIWADIEHSPESASGLTTNAKSPVASQVMSRSSFSSPSQFQHGIKHSSYSTMPPLSEERYIPFVKHETPFSFSSPHAFQRESYLTHPQNTIYPTSQGVNIKSEHERLSVPAIQFLERNARYPDGIYRSLSSDFAQSLQVRPYALRPTQPRSLSPRIDMQEEPEDLSTRTRTRSAILSPTESQRPHSFSFSGSASENVNSSSGIDSPMEHHDAP